MELKSVAKRKTRNHLTEHRPNVQNWTSRSDKVGFGDANFIRDLMEQQIEGNCGVHIERQKFRAILSLARIRWTLTSDLIV